MTEPRVLVGAGMTGVIGRHVSRRARAAGWSVRGLTRATSDRAEAGDDVEWHAWQPRAAADGDHDALDAVRAALDGADLVVNLAGASLAEGRLDADHKARVLDSRLASTSALAKAHALCSNPPPIWFQASATGYYGDAADAEVTEASPPGDLFLSEVCQKWEAAAPPSPRVIVGRIGLVLAGDAPAFKKLLAPIRWGVGGRLGSGEQWYAWIDADDLARAVLFLADDPTAAGVYNLTTPDPVRQVDLVKRAAKRLGRPAVLPAPAFMLRLALGQVADELLLPSCKALPARLTEAGFNWERGRLDDELDHLLANP